MAADARIAPEHAIRLLSLGLEEIAAGVALFDAEGRRILGNVKLGAVLNLPGALSQDGVAIADLVRHQVARGDFGPPPADPEAMEVAMTKAMGPFANGPGAATWVTPDGQAIELKVRRAADGGFLAVWRDVTAVRRDQAALRDERARTRHLLENMTDVVILMDADGKILESSHKGGELLGLPPDMPVRGMLHQDILRLLYRRGDYGFDVPEDEFVARRRAGILAAGRLTFSSRMPDGRWVEYNFRPLPEGQLLIIIRDITALKESAAAVESERNLLRHVLDGLKDAVVLIDERGVIVETNGRAAGLLGVPDHLVAPGAHHSDLLRWQYERGAFGFDRPVEAVIAERWNRGIAPGGVHEIRPQPDGRWVEYNVHHLPDRRFLIVLRDVTELKQSAGAIEAERNLLRRVLGTMQDSVVLLDRDGIIIESNDRAADLLGMPGELVRRGSSHDDILRWRHARGDFGDRPVEQVIAERRREVTAPSGLRQIRRMPNGKWVDFSFQALPEDQLLIVCRDITALKSAAEEALAAKSEAEAARDAAEAAAQAKATFLAAMSHEIRTPMNGVLGMMEILDRTGLNPDQSRSVAVMRESAQSLLRIIDDILDFSKIDAGRMEIEALPFSLNGLVGGAVDTLMPQASGKGLALFADPPGKGPDWVNGDPTRVRQILFNLLGNAIKFTERGFVRVMTETRPEQDGKVAVMIAVEDSGIGMDAESMSRLFRPFAQADTSTTRRFGGTGLGLSIVRRLAQLMGGDAKAESVPGRGSRFTVLLRLDAAMAPNANPNGAANGTAPARGRRADAGTPRLLVADDHPVNREVLERQLALLGLEADLAEDGVAALECWRRQRHSVVLLDLHMPRMDGLDLTRAIRREEQANGLVRSALIAVTANALKGEDERCYAAGMDGFLSKPVALDTLGRVLSRWIPSLATERTLRGTGALYDPEALRSLFGADQARLNAILESFAESVSGEVAAIAKSTDSTELAHLAHRLKGAARMVGARLLAEQAAQVEAAARQGDVAAARAAAEGIESLMGRTLETARQAHGVMS
ncbi:PAS-domain containing protein [Muricoccus radiodurans]|uniref:PAS-domain containing protein n=1 Tax=Muricoccus radiodurans TaxID=2231721 RepID=UPI003CE9045D